MPMNQSRVLSVGYHHLWSGGVLEENAHPMQSQGLITSGTSPAPQGHYQASKSMRLFKEKNCWLHIWCS